MRRYNRFKILNTKNIFFYFLKKRILSFKRPKWLFAQKKINILKKKLLNFKSFKNQVLRLQLCVYRKENTKLKIKKTLKPFIKKKARNILNSLYVNFKYLQCKFNSWQRARFFFKENLNMKNQINTYFDGGFSVKFYKSLFLNTYSRDYSLCSVFIRPEYRLDILLWRLQIASSLYFAEYIIKKKYVLINSKNVGLKHFVKEGDIIFLKNIKLFNFKNCSDLYIFSNLLPPYVEVDFYLGQFIILKNWTTFVSKDLISIVRAPLKISRIKNYYLH
jgi:ribosomal protein S4